MIATVYQRPPRKSVVPTPLFKLQGLRPIDVARLAVFKTRRYLTTAAERRGGTALLQKRARRFADRWAREYGDAGFIRWLDRPGGGRFWYASATGSPSGDALAWARSTCTERDVELAEATAAGRFDLIGSGPVELGRPPAWRTDLYTGSEWPLVPSSSVRLFRNDGSDIRTVWELSRCYHFTALARAWATTGDSAWPTAFVDHVTSFDRQNPFGHGPHWASPMDVAIRAANWCLAAPVFAHAGLPTDFWARTLANLWLSGIHVERHLEWHPVYRGNHFVANLVGLVYLGTLFRGTRDGDRWLSVGRRGLEREIEYQVGADAVSFEGSLAYHRLVTELFAYAGQLLQRNVSAFDAAPYMEKLGRMYRFIAEYTQPDGRAPMIGDADDGRLHWVDAESPGAPRRHTAGLPPGPPISPTDGVHTYPYGGFHVIRHDDHHAVIRCGGVGLRGAGSHDHNDQLSCEIVVAGRRTVVDSGTYAYTRDLRARHAYRSVAAHSCVQLGEEEPNPIDMQRPWRILEDRTRSHVLRCERDGDELLFSGQHHGYAHRPSGAICRRELRLNTQSGVWTIVDDIEGQGVERMTWRIHLDSTDVLIGEVVEAAGSGVAQVRVDVAGVVVELQFPAGLTCAVEATEGSNAYGHREPRSALVLSGPITLPARIAGRLHGAGKD